MLIYVLDNGVWQDTSADTIKRSDPHVLFMCADEMDQPHEIDPVDTAIVKECLRRQAFTFDHRDTTDYVGVLFLSGENVKGAGRKFCLCAGFNRLTVIYEYADQADLIIGDLLAASADAPSSISGLFIAFMEKVIHGHIEQHERIEDEIASLETAFLTDRKNLGPGRILVLQKKLLMYKRFYEQLQHVLDDIQESKHGLIDDGSRRLFTLYTRRIERLLRNVLVLREYVTQVRESYEAETDISLNSIMRLFTVVTVIFLPLTLLVGWYGMNLPMPEYHWVWSYPLVIALSIMIVVLTILVFKKNKWF